MYASAQAGLTLKSQSDAIIGLKQERAELEAQHNAQVVGAQDEQAEIVALQEEYATLQEMFDERGIACDGLQEELAAVCCSMTEETKRQRDRIEELEEQLKMGSLASTEAQGEAAKDHENLQEELSTAWSEAQRAQKELDEGRQQMSELKHSLSAANEAVAQLQTQFNNAVGGVNRRRIRSSVRDAWNQLRYTPSPLARTVLVQCSQQTVSWRQTYVLQRTLYLWKSTIDHHRLTEGELKHDAAISLYFQRSADTVARQRRRRHLQHAMATWSLCITHRQHLKKSTISAGVQMLVRFARSTTIGLLKEAWHLWNYTMMESSAHSLSATVVQGWTTNMHQNAAAAVRRIFLRRDTSMIQRILLMWWSSWKGSLRLSRPPTPKGKIRRSADRGIVSKENSGSVSPTRKSRTRPNSPVKVLRDSITSRPNSPDRPIRNRDSNSQKDLSWREEIGMVKQRIGLLQRKHEHEITAAAVRAATPQDEELHNNSLLSDISVEGIHRAGAHVVARVFKQQRHMELLRIFTEWTALSRSSRRESISLAEYQKMKDDNRCLQQRLEVTEQQRLAAEEIGKLQKTANEALRRRVVHA